MTLTITAATLHHAVEQAGHRLTGARGRLLQAIAARPEGFTAEELSVGLPGVGRATVYRTLKLLLELGLVCKMALPSGAPRYTLAGRGHHHHAICVQCGTVSEFRQELVERMLRNLRGEVGASVGHRIEVYVVCPRCASEQTPLSNPRKEERS